MINTAEILRGKVLVVKYGGSAMLNPELAGTVIDDVAAIVHAGARVILVHGGGPDINKMLKALGKESPFVDGLRYTDAETMEVVQMVLCGKVNKDIVAMMAKIGIQALGISGIDAGLLTAVRRQPKGKDLGLVGDIRIVRTSVLERILGIGFVPIVSPVALEEGSTTRLNINADTAAAEIAVAMKAEKLILLSDVNGIYRDLSDEDTLIKTLTLAELEKLRGQNLVYRGMIPKAECCACAILGGVKAVHIIDGRVSHALQDCLFAGDAPGTTILPSPPRRPKSHTPSS